MKWRPRSLFPELRHEGVAAIPVVVEHCLNCEKKDRKLKEMTKAHEGLREVIVQLRKRVRGA
jgi:hypothetical protein